MESRLMGAGGYLLRQFAQPHGRLGGFFTELMNRGNSVLNAYAIEALHLQEGNRTLDVGFGGAAALSTLVQDRRVSFTGGLDPSAEVVRRAESRLSASIEAGRLEVKLGVAEAIPWPDASFDRVMSVNSIYYWRDPAQGAREIGRVLRPGGAVVVALRSKAAIEKLGIESYGYQAFGERDVGALLERAGLGDIQVQAREDKHRGGAMLVRAQKALDQA